MFFYFISRTNTLTAFSSGRRGTALAVDEVLKRVQQISISTQSYDTSSVDSRLRRLPHFSHWRRLGKIASLAYKIKFPQTASFGLWELLIIRISCQKCYSFDNVILLYQNQSFSIPSFSASALNCARVSAKNAIASSITAGEVISMPATLRLSRGEREPPHLRKSIY